MSQDSSLSRPPRIHLSIDVWAVLIAFAIAALIWTNLFPSIGW